MSKAKRKHTQKPQERHQLEEQASPELRSLIDTHNILTIGNWPDALTIKGRHGHESEIAKHVEKVWAKSNKGRVDAFRAAISFPARGYADLAAKLAFARDDRQIRAWEPAAAVFTGLYKDVQRLAKTMLPDTADKELLDRISECEEAMTVHRALSERYDREREEAERAADAAGYHEAKGYSPGEAWRIRSDYIDRITPSGSYDRWNAAHKEIGRTARAVFGMKAKTLRGAIAKLRLVVALIKADDLDTWQGDKDWLAETLADFERIEAAK
jgi:hypothetical protein